MKIGAKIVAGYVAILLLMCFVGFLGYRGMQEVADGGREMHDNYLTSIVVVAKGQHALDELLHWQKSHIISPDDESMNHAEAKLGEVIEEAKVAFAEYRAIGNERGEGSSGKLERIFEELLTLNSKVIELSRNNDDDEANEMSNSEFQEKFEEAEGIIKEIRNDNSGKASIANQNNLDTTRSSSILLLSLVGIGVILGLGMGFWLSRRITLSLKEIQFGADRLAQKDLNVEINTQSRDEFGDVARSFLTMSESLNDSLNQVAMNADQITNNSQEIATSSQTISRGAMNQASSLEQISSSMQVMTAQTKMNAQNAGQADELAASARQQAEDSNSQMQRMLNAMVAINKASEDISKIIKVIDEIAFQTNLLALNAAVEAARAGVHGKGFAVVAEEVRNLAQRSASAAKEITDMIEDSIQKVKDGTKIADETAGSLVQIVDAITEVSTLANQITSASNEQASGVDEITKGLEQLNVVTQQNTAIAEKSSFSSQDLFSRAQQLKSLVNNFHLKADNQSPTPVVDAMPQENSAPPMVAPPPPPPPPPAAPPKQVMIQPTEPATPAPAPAQTPPRIELNDDEFGKF